MDQHLPNVVVESGWAANNTGPPKSVVLRATIVIDSHEGPYRLWMTMRDSMDNKIMAQVQGMTWVERNSIRQIVTVISKWLADSREAFGPFPSGQHPRNGPYGSRSVAGAEIGTGEVTEAGAS